MIAHAEYIGERPSATEEIRMSTRDKIGSIMGTAMDVIGGTGSVTGYAAGRVIHATGKVVVDTTRGLFGKPYNNN